MLCCDRCPGAYHEACLEAHGYLGKSKQGIQKDTFVCPQHMCRSCGRRAGAAGGVLIACTECPACFCEEHEPEEGVVLDSTGNDRWTALGMKQSRTTYYCRCSKGCEKFHATRISKGPEAAIKQVNADIAAETRARKKQEREMKKSPKSGKKRKKSSSSTSSASTSSASTSSASTTSTTQLAPLYVPDRPIIPPRFGVPGEVLDYDGHRWYICHKSETPGQVSWDQDIDCALLVYQNQNITGLGRSSKLLGRTPLLLGRGASDFLTKKEAQELLNTDPNSHQSGGGGAKKRKPRVNKSALAAAARRKLKEENQQVTKGLNEDYHVIYGKSPPKVRDTKSNDRYRFF